MLRNICTILLACAITFAAQAQGSKIKPVTPKASPEATALLDYLQGLAGQHTLSGQHNFPLSGDRNTQFAGDYIGKTPVVWSQDFGFAKDGDKDSYLVRPALVKEAIRQHKLGAIVTFCWHAVPPTANEPVTFQPLPGADPSKLASVQGKLTDQQFKDLLTPGTAIHKQWAKQVDEIASYLKQLQEAKVPVLWRPYHEMNGDWFWWGGRHEGKYTTAALYRQIFDRMVNHHKLNNLIWVWSVDRPSQPGREFVKYYPGTKYLDVLSIDIYGNDFNQSYYDGLLSLSEGKPVALGEVGNPPAPEILDKQPKWLYWVVWSGMTKGTSRSDYQKLANGPRALFMEDSVYVASVNKLRPAFALDPLPAHKAADFSGSWVLNECESNIQGGGPAIPFKVAVSQKDGRLIVTSTSESEWQDDEVAEQTLKLDGEPFESKGFMGAPRIQRATWSAHRDMLTVDSEMTLNFGGRESKITGKDVWKLAGRGTRLVIVQESDSPFGKRSSTVVYNRAR